jgi:hypothetical protein
MSRRESPLDTFGHFSPEDPVARLIVQYFFPADFLHRDFHRVHRALAAQKRRTRWRSAQETCYLRLWLAALYTVAEGYKALRLQNSEIDSLLTTSYLDSLRLFRNGTFHYQRHPEKHVQFFSDGEASTNDRLDWAEKLHAAFDRFQRDYRIEITVRNALAARRGTE